MPRQYTTLEEANAMIPELRRSFILLFQLHIHVKLLMGELERVGHAPRSDSFEVLVEGADPSINAARARLRAAIDLMRDELNVLRGQGCIVRDIEAGNVSWYAHDEERGDYILSWRAGEKTITHWIEIGKGTIERRPLSELRTKQTDAPTPRTEKERPRRG